MRLGMTVCRPGLLGALTLAAVWLPAHVASAQAPIASVAAEPAETVEEALVPGEIAVDLRDDIAVAKIELGLVEIALGDLKVGLGLLDVRRVGRQPIESAIDVAFFYERLDHGAGPLVERMDDAELSSALNERRLRLEHGRKGLIEIGRNLAEILPVGVRRQA